MPATAAETLKALQAMSPEELARFPTVQAAARAAAEAAIERPATEAFEHELAALIERHGHKLTDNQIITTLERALDEALVVAGDLEASRVRIHLIAALKPFANLGVGDGPDYEHDSAPYRLTRGSIRNARAALSMATSAKQEAA